MITMNLDIHGFMWAVEGFARGSHLRQGIWEDMFNKYIPQMTDDEKDYCWWIMRRDLWENFFFGEFPAVGAEDYLRVLAALHKNNRAIVKVEWEGEVSEHLCYKYANHWRPYSKSFHSCVNVAAIIGVNRVDKQENRFVEKSHQDWWEDLSIYDKTIREISDTSF